MRVKRRRLPHLEAIGEPLFLTFRLKGSLPDRTDPSRQPPSPPAKPSSQWIPTPRRRPHRSNLAKTTPHRGIIENSSTAASTLRHYDLHAWVIMPNHVHLLLTPQVNASNLLRALKSTTASGANQLLNTTGPPFWQDESYDHLVRNNDEFRNIQRYIENNPVKACLAATPEQYPWSSATLP